MINIKICGIYKITNKINGECYIGASVNIKARFRDHLRRNLKLYPHIRFYQEVLRYGENNYVCEILEECAKDELLKREQFYYDLYLPTYNEVRPIECNFTYDEIRNKALLACQTEQFKKKRMIITSSEKFIETCRKGQVYKYKKVKMIKSMSVINEFDSISEASRFISENTSFTGKNKASKIKAVCDGERITAYGYKWEYSEV